MTELGTTEEIMREAKRQESEYDWLGAAKSYQKALLVFEPRLSERAGIHELSGYAFYRAARQSDAPSDFRERVQAATLEYEEARQSFAELELGRGPRELRCRAMIAYLAFMIGRIPDKQALAVESWKLAKESMNQFHQARDLLEYCKTYNILAETGFYALVYDSSFQSRKNIIQEVVSYGEKSVDSLSTLGDSIELARSCVRLAAALGELSFRFVEDKNWAPYMHRCAELWRKAVGISEEEALLEISSPLGFCLTLVWSKDEGARVLEKALAPGRKTRDRLIIGSIMDQLAFLTPWRVETIEDPGERLELTERSLHYAEEASRHYSSIEFSIPRSASLIWDHVPYAEHHLRLAEYETDPKKRRDRLQKAREAALEGLRQTEKYESLAATAAERELLSDALTALARIEPSPENRKLLLDEALDHRNFYTQMLEQLYPLSYYSQGWNQNSVADIQYQLAELSKNPESKTRILLEATKSKETGLILCENRLQEWERAGISREIEAAGLAAWGYQHGVMLESLFMLTRDSDYSKRAVSAFEKWARTFQRLDLRSRTAECYWKVAQVSLEIEEHSRAAEYFLSASKEYRSAAENILALKDLYLDHATYMEGWHEIELARNSHTKQEYSQASKHYEKAAELHKATKQWNYLAPNYSAWASVELAEDYSRREESREAIQRFQDGIERFAVARGTLLAESNKVEGSEEKQMISKLAKATEIRRDYCKARIALEEGRILDKRGDHSSSSEKYGEAASTLEKMMHDLESDERRRDIQLVMTLSNAWKIMAQAEAEASSELYLKASRLFEEAKDLNTSEKGKMLSLGHSRFCLALEAGTRFADVRDPALHDTAMQALESAANYYLKAGSKSSSDYSKATGLLYDAYLRLDRAKKEEDQEKKTKIYAMVAKLLQASAAAYASAGYLGKEDEVQRLYDNVKGDHELSLSLTEVLHAPSTLSSPEAFVMPNPTFEKAVGLERFENADVQANLIAPRTILQVGETVDIEIELVNAGRGPARLIKIEEVIVPGFDVTSAPQSYRIEDSHLNMRGRRLDPLKTEEIKLVLRPNVQGQFTLKPRVLYLDESGKYKSHEPEPIEVTVGGPRPGFERRLSAIMFTDVVGYTSLTGKNESLALELLEEHRRLLRPFFPMHHGKEVKTVADMFLVEFASALEAVRCAIQIQGALSERNLHCPEDNKIHVRIGVHVGDVEHSQGDVYGDAVNVASRIEPLAEPGGIVITRQVYEQVRNRPDIKMHPMGGHELKNVKEPLELFSVLP